MLRIPKDRRPLVWLGGKISTPPFSSTARKEAGYYLGCVQDGELLSMPHSRAMPGIGHDCHELRVRDAAADWRIIYRIDPDAVLVVEIFRKKTPETPPRIIGTCRTRLRSYDLNS